MFFIIMKIKSFYKETNLIAYYHFFFKLEKQFLLAYFLFNLTFSMAQFGCRSIPFPFPFRTDPVRFPFAKFEEKYNTAKKNVIIRNSNFIGFKTYHENFSLQF